jgi:HlyD family secretion protein
VHRILIFFICIIGLLAATVVYVNLAKTKTTDSITLYGNVDVRQVDIAFRVDGRVDRLLFQEGDFVAEGSLMSTLDTDPYKDEVRRAKAAVASAKATLLNAKLILKRRKELLNYGGAAQEDYENAIASKKIAQSNLKEAIANLGVALTSLKDTRVFAPADGVILTRIREPGSVAKAADPICTLSLTSPVWIRAFIREPQLGIVYPGMPAEITTDTKGGPVYKGHVGFISPVAEFTPKTVETTELRVDLVYRIRVIADNPDNGLRQGMPVTVKLLLAEKKK